MMSKWGLNRDSFAPEAASRFHSRDGAGYSVSSITTATASFSWIGEPTDLKNGLSHQSPGDASIQNYEYMQPRTCRGARYSNIHFSLCHSAAFTSLHDGNLGRFDPVTFAFGPKTRSNSCKKNAFFLLLTEPPGRLD